LEKLVTQCIDAHGRRGRRGEEWALHVPPQKTLKTTQCDNAI